MKDGLFFRDGFDLEIYVLEYLHYITGESDLLEDALHDFIYAQNFYLGSDLKLHRFV